MKTTKIFLLTLIHILLTKTTDIDMIGFFVGDCPEDWTIHDKLKGKFILGSSDNISVNLYGKLKINP